LRTKLEARRPTLVEGREMTPEANPNFLHAIEGEMLKRNARVRAIIAESGPDAVAEFDRNMKDIRTGVSHARNLWHSITEAQRRAMTELSQGRFNCKPVTLRCLMQRGLAVWDAPKPELSEHGRFVLKFGRP